MKKIYLSLLVIFAGAWLSFPLSAYALKVQPMILDQINLSPGQSAKKVVRLTNDSTGPITYKPTFYDAQPGQDETGRAQYVLPTQDPSLANWITVAPSELTLQAGESQNVDVRIQVPENGIPGSHLALVGWGSAAINPIEGGANLVGLTGVNVAINVSGATIDKADVLSFTTEGDQTKYERLPVKFITRINNQGNQHFKPQGVISVKDAFGRVVASLPFNDTNAGGNVLAGSTRIFSTDWVEGFAFGKYTAVLDITMGKAGPATATYSFWVLPTGLLILWLVLAVIILAILGMLIKNMMGSMKK